MTAQQQVSRLETLLALIQRNAALPRPRDTTAGFCAPSVEERVAAVTDPSPLKVEFDPGERGLAFDLPGEGELAFDPREGTDTPEPWAGEHGSPLPRVLQVPDPDAARLALVERDDGPDVEVWSELSDDTFLDDDDAIELFIEEEGEIADQSAASASPSGAEPLAASQAEFSTTDASPLDQAMERLSTSPVSAVVEAWPGGFDVPVDSTFSASDPFASERDFLDLADLTPPPESGEEPAGFGVVDRLTLESGHPSIEQLGGTIELEEATQVALELGEPLRHLPALGNAAFAGEDGGSDELAAPALALRRPAASLLGEAARFIPRTPANIPLFVSLLEQSLRL